jgi:3-dehydroquinate dehydratase II
MTRKEIYPEIWDLLEYVLVHGPNLNRLGSRNPDVYGAVTLEEIVQAAGARAREYGLEVVPFQSNHEGELIDWLQAQAAGANAVLINPGCGLACA